MDTLTVTDRLIRIRALIRRPELVINELQPVLQYIGP